MKAKLISFVLLIAATFVFTGCPDKIEPETPEVKPPIEEATSTDGLQTIKIGDNIMAIVGNEDWNAITRSNGIIVAVGNNYSVAYSGNGVDWQMSSLEANNNTAGFYNVIYDGEYWVAAGSRLVFTKDFDTWTQVTDDDGTGYPSNSFLKKRLLCTYGAGVTTRPVYVGLIGKYIYYSRDKRNWTKTLINTPGFDYLSDSIICYDEKSKSFKILICVQKQFWGEDGTMFLFDFKISDTNVSLNLIGECSVQGYESGMFRPEICYTFSFNGDWYIMSTDLGHWRSNDGINWERINVGNLTDILTDIIVLPNKTFLALSVTVISPYIGTFYVSNDGETWTVQNTINSGNLKQKCFIALLE